MMSAVNTETLDKMLETEVNLYSSYLQKLASAGDVENGTAHDAILAGAEILRQAYIVAHDEYVHAGGNDQHFAEYEKSKNAPCAKD